MGGEGETPEEKEGLVVRVGFDFENEDFEEVFFFFFFFFSIYLSFLFLFSFFLLFLSLFPSL